MPIPTQMNISETPMIFKDQKETTASNILSPILEGNEDDEYPILNIGGLGKSRQLPYPIQLEENTPVKMRINETPMDDSIKKSRIRRPPPPIPDNLFDEDPQVNNTRFGFFRDPQEYSTGEGILTPISEEHFEDDYSLNPNVEVKRGGRKIQREYTPIMYTSPSDTSSTLKQGGGLSNSPRLEGFFTPFLNPNIELKRGGNPGREATPINFTPPEPKQGGGTETCLLYTSDAADE